MENLLQLLQFLGCMAGAVYFLYLARKLLTGEDVWISGYSRIPDEDIQYYDHEKVKKYAGYMNIGCAVGCLFLAASVYIPAAVIFLAGIAILGGCLVGFRYALLETKFFKKAQ